jgi:hypothetical protein
MLPPALLYGFGAVLMILGGLRAYHLGWKRKLEEQAEAAARAASSSGAADDEEGEGGLVDAGDDRRDAGWRRRDGGGYKRHLVWGLLWIGIGLFLIISTFMQRGR